MGEQVTKTRQRGLVVGDDNRSVAARPQTIAPLVKASSLLGDVGVYELHELGELVRTRR